MTIKKMGGGEVVVSHTGKRLTKPKSHAGAVKDLRRIEYFKHHAKCIVDPSLVKAAEIGSAMQQYSPVVFQTKGHQKPDEVKADKKDFPSTAKAFDLQNTLQRDFPSTAEHDMTIADAFANPLAGEKSWNGPDVQMKGSDHIQSHKRTTKSVTIAGRKIRLVKGSEGSNNGNLGGYPIDATEEREKRKAFFDAEKMKEKVKAHEDSKRYAPGSVLALASGPDGYLGRSKNSGKIGEYTVESPDRTKVYKRANIDPNKPHTVSLIHYSPEALAKKEKRAKNKVSLKSKVGKIVLQYTQNQPLAAGFKPLIAYLTQTEDKDETDAEKAMTTSQIAEKIGKPKKVAPSSASRIRLMERAAKEKTEETANEPGPHPDFGSTGGYRGNPAKLGKGHANPIDGGIGDDLEYKDVDPKELEAGIEVEQEHVGNDPNIDDDEKRVKGADIAMDHLKEDENYYTHLAEMERASKEEDKSETQKRKLLSVDEATKSEKVVNLADYRKKKLEEKKGDFPRPYSVTKAEEETSKEVDKSVIKERKLAGTVANAEKMVGIREATGASPSEMKTTVGQLRAYTAKLKAEREKNKGLVVKALLREERDPSSKAYKKLQREQKVKDRTPKEYEKREKVFND